MRYRVLLILIAWSLAALLFSACASLSGRGAAPTIAPIVSSDWLEQNLGAPELVVIDIRDPGSYAAGHIPKSVNEPFVTAFDPCTGPTSKWITSGPDCLWLEMPAARDLFTTIGGLGITPDSAVVIVTAPNPKEPPYYGLANATRVADTLMYAGVSNVAVLDGGYPKWVGEGRPITQTAGSKPATVYKGQVMEFMVVRTEYVKARTEPGGHYRRTGPGSVLRGRGRTIRPKGRTYTHGCVNARTLGLGME